MRIGRFWKKSLLGICLIDSASFARVDLIKGGELSTDAT
jgi:hypothetical protein